MSSKKTVESGACAKAAELDLATKILWSLIFLPRHLLNAIYSLSTGWRSRPVFLPVESVCPALLDLEENYAVIKQEVEGILPNRQFIPQYHELDPQQRLISGSEDPNQNWKVFLLYAMGEKPARNRQKCRRTAELLDGIPNLFQAFFSILEGGKSIPAHEGPYRGYLRYHLALKVPERDPPSMRIKDQIVTWKEGEGFLFDDTWNHEVRNKSQDIRVVLVVDLIRPLRPVGNAINRIVCWALRYLYAKRLVAKA
jgi:aspartyl/asparaginyl beta-hydroxylase (cupin superfamily)